MAKLLDTLWEYRGLDITLSELAEEAGIHYTTLMKLLPILEELDMVRMTRQVGNAKLYQINKNDEMVQKLVTFLNSLNVRACEIEATKQERSKKLEIVVR